MDLNIQAQPMSRACHCLLKMKIFMKRYDGIEPIFTIKVNIQLQSWEMYVEVECRGSQILVLPSRIRSEAESFHVLTLFFRRRYVFCLWLGEETSTMIC